MTDAIHIHEDDWAMRNLYPEEAADQVVDEMLAAHEAGERNRAPGGLGWTDLHVIKPPSIDYSDVRLSLAETAAALAHAAKEAEIAALFDDRGPSAAR